MNRKYILTVSLLLAVSMITGCSLKDMPECKDGETRCINENFIAVCESNMWLESQPCKNQRCEVRDDVAACVNICETGDKKCEGNVLLECDEDHMWPDVALGTECREEEQCVSMSAKTGEPISVCLNPHNREQIIQVLVENNIDCTEDLLLCGDDNILYNCITNELNPLKECGEQVCGAQESGIMDCIDACQPGYTKCEGNNLVTCTENKIFGSGEACPGDTVCAMNKDGINECIEKNQDIVLCSADKCIGNTFYQCKDGVWDNGTECSNGCSLISDGKYGCVEPCENGAMKCDHNRVMTCNNNAKWKAVSSCGADGYCMEKSGEAYCECRGGFEYHSESGRCEMLCQPGCSDNYMITCAADGTMTRTKCILGCDSDAGVCRTCQPGCSEDGTMEISCASEYSIERISCTFGCDNASGKCAKCEDSCSEDGMARIVCEGGSRLITENCEKYGWKNGHCENAQCIYTECDAGFTMNDRGECIQTMSIMCAAGMESSTMIDGLFYCGIPISTADDLIALRNALNSGNISDAPGAPVNMASTIYIVMNDIDLGVQTDWIGIGTKEHPFNGMMAAKNANIKITGTISCVSETYCSLFAHAAENSIKGILIEVQTTVQVD